MFHLYRSYHVRIFYLQFFAILQIWHDHPVVTGQSQKKLLFSCRRSLISIYWKDKNSSVYLWKMKIPLIAIADYSKFEITRLLRKRRCRSLYVFFHLALFQVAQYHGWIFALVFCEPTILFSGNVIHFTKLAMIAYFMVCVKTIGVNTVFSIQKYAKHKIAGISNKILYEFYSNPFWLYRCCSR